MLDGTPVLDIKPYIAYSDAHPGAGGGWLEKQGPGVPDPVGAWVVAFDGLATEQAAWIETHTGLAIRERIRSTLSLGPEPHPYRRIRHTELGMQLAVKEWRIRFAVTGKDVRVQSIDSGFRASQIESGDVSVQSHRAFLAIWPRAPGKSSLA